MALKNRRLGDAVPTALLTLYVLVFFVFMLAPIVVVVISAFTAGNYISIPIQGFSLRWFVSVYEYAPFFNSFILSVEIALASAALGTVLSIPVALKLAKSTSVYASAAVSFLLSPLSMPAIVLGFALLFYLASLGLPLSFMTLLIAHTVVAIPYILRTVMGVYRSIPSSFEEAACVLGANPWQVFTHVTLPLIRPGIFAGCLFAVLISIDNLPLSFFFSSVRTNTLPVVVLSYVENQFDPAVAAISVIQLGFAIVALLVVDRLYGLRRMTVAV